MSEPSRPNLEDPLLCYQSSETHKKYVCSHILLCRIRW